MTSEQEAALGAAMMKAAREEGHMKKLPPKTGADSPVRELTAASIRAEAVKGHSYANIAINHGVSRGSLNYWFTKHGTNLAKLMREGV